MTSFRIVTDGACDLMQDWCREHQITVIPLYYSLSSAQPVAFTARGNDDFSDFYAMLRKGAPVHTSAPSIEDCKEQLRPILAEGADVLYTGLSGALSGMFNVMRLAAMELAEEFPEREVRVVDSRCGSHALGALIRALADVRETGGDLATAAKTLEVCRSHIACRFTVSDLMYLKRGGRISGSAAMVGTVLQIMPMLRLTDDGRIEPYGKVRGRKLALRTLADAIGEAVAPVTSVTIGHCDAAEDAAFVRDILRRKYALSTVRIEPIGPILGAHAGPGAIAAFCGE